MPIHCFPRPAHEHRQTPDAAWLRQYREIDPKLVEADSDPENVFAWQTRHAGLGRKLIGAEWPDGTRAYLVVAKGEEPEDWLLANSYLNALKLPGVGH